MTQDHQQENRAGRRRRRHLWLPLTGGLLLVLVLAGAWVLNYGTITSPKWANRQLAILFSDMADGSQVDVETVRLSFEAGFQPTLIVENLNLRRDSGEVVVLSEVEARLLPEFLWTGKFAPTTLTVTGGSARISRSEGGSFGIEVPTDELEDESFASVGALLDGVNQLFDEDNLGLLDEVRFENLSLIYDDQKSGRIWTVADAGMTFVQDDDVLSLDARIPFQSDTGAPAGITLQIDRVRVLGETHLGVVLDQVSAKDIGDEIEALAWLSVLDARVTGEMRTTLQEDGSLTTMSGTLALGDGQLAPTEATASLPFESGALSFEFDGQEGRLNLTEIEFNSRLATIRGQGFAYLSELVEGTGNRFVGQLRLSGLDLNPDGVFENELGFEFGALDFRMNIDPFTVEIGQVSLVKDDAQLVASGNAEARADGWRVSLDAGIDQLSVAQLPEIWPVNLIPKTREWIMANLLSGRILDLNAAIRLVPGAPRRTAVDFDFVDTSVRYMKFMPPMEKGVGHVAIEDNSFTLRLNRGFTMAGPGLPVDMAGSYMRIPDMTIKPSPAEFYIKTESALPAALRMIDKKPLELMHKTGQSVDVATGDVTVDAVVKLPLKKRVPFDELSFDVAATARNVRSDLLIPGRVAEAAALAIRADNASIAISGDGTLDGVPVSATWTQKIGPAHAGKSQLVGHIELSERAIEAFQIGLPKGSVAGIGEGDIVIDLNKGEAPRLALTSSLRDLVLAIPALGWRKGASVPGRLDVEVRLAGIPEVTKLELDAAGLKAAGTVGLRDDRSLDAVRLSSVRLGRWLDVVANIKGRGPGRPVEIEVPSGRLDIRGMVAAGSSPSNEGGPVTLRLNELRISDGIALNTFVGDFTQQGGFSGGFSGLVNGEGRVTGDLVPTARGSAIRIRSDEAGPVIRSTGAFSKGRGGTMELLLQPTGSSGSFDGSLSIKNINVIGANVLAELLSAISVVGLLQQLAGEGIGFSDVQARFRLSPEGIIITSSSAIGPSMGVSADGYYTFANSNIDVQGVVSPIYALNGLGQIFTRNREGLVGFNYVMRGPASDPVTSINPLSAFTPGFFREIFKRPPPKVSN